MLPFAIFLCLSVALGDKPVTFPEDPPKSNDTIQNRFGWSILGNYLKALDSMFGDDLGASIQTQTAPTIPQTTEDRIVINGMTFPPSGIFPAGIVTAESLFPSAVEVDGSVDVVEFSKCECRPAELCTNHTTRDGIHTRIVTRPPTGISCRPGEVYCCIEAPKLGCGIPNIISGVAPKEGQANLGEFPWSAIILTNDDLYVGGGVLIDSTHVLTAAHKVAKYGNGAGLKIRLGDWDLSNEYEPVNFQEVKITKIVNHPMFDASTLKNDISLITLATPVATLTRPYPQINTICLPEPTALFTGSRCRVAGWGKNRFNGEYQNIIKKVEVPVLSSIDCQTKLRNTRLGSSFVLDTNSFICAGGEAERDACTGDGGTALACLRGGQYYLVGITAGGIECGNENVPALYVNMVNYLTWVNAQINGGNEGNGGIDPRRRPT